MAPMVRAMAVLLAIGAIVGACSSPVASPSPIASPTDESPPEAIDAPTASCPEPSTPPTADSTPRAAAQVDWSGPVRSAAGEPVMEAMVCEEGGRWSWAEPAEALPGWLDITRLVAYQTVMFRLRDADDPYCRAHQAGECIEEMPPR